MAKCKHVVIEIGGNPLDIYPQETELAEFDEDIYMYKEFHSSMFWLSLDYSN